MKSFKKIVFLVLVSLQLSSIVFAQSTRIHISGIKEEYQVPDSLMGEMKRIQEHFLRAYDSVALINKTISLDFHTQSADTISPQASYTMVFAAKMVRDPYLEMDLILYQIFLEHDLSGKRWLDIHYRPPVEDLDSHYKDLKKFNLLFVTSLIDNLVPMDEDLVSNASDTVSDSLPVVHIRSILFDRRSLPAEAQQDLIRMINNTFVYFERGTERHNRSMHTLYNDGDFRSIPFQANRPIPVKNASYVLDFWIWKDQATGMIHVSANISGKESPNLIYSDRIQMNHTFQEQAFLERDFWESNTKITKWLNTLMRRQFIYKLHR